MIRRFTINGFKRFERETKIDLDAVTLLVGANNSGKSTILEALTLFQYCVETTRRANGKEPDKRQLNLSRRSVGPDEFGVLPVAEPTDLWPNGRTTIGRKQQAIELHGEYDNGADISFTLKLSYNKFSISPRSSGDIATALGRSSAGFAPGFRSGDFRCASMTMTSSMPWMRYPPTSRECCASCNGSAEPASPRLGGNDDRRKPQAAAPVLAEAGRIG